ncbi:MAG TPA: histone deacetylase family protein [Anaerolineae bacterium]|nr:histone deacetylase family protein [Anaerolineae bacterium]
MRIVYTDKHKLHATDRVERGGQPYVVEEAPARAEIILQAAQASRLGAVITPVDHGLDPILAVHDAGFVDYLCSAYAGYVTQPGRADALFADYYPPRRARRRPAGFPGLRSYYAFGNDDPILAGTWDAAYWSAQCALTAADLVRAYRETAYALCRPPGHHAGVDFYGGYCYLNNAAIAARYLQARVAILDIDYHHGNGTQEIFYSDPAMLTCSLHADPDEEYPYYWGGADELGTEAGEGFNRNWPLPLGTGDAAYLETLDEALAVVRDFGPEYFVISAGFDIVAGDPGGGFKVTTAGLAEIGRRIAGLAGHVPTLIVQEGGYLLDELGTNAVAFLSAFVRQDV